MLGRELIVELGIEILYLSVEVPRDALLARERLQQEVLGTKEGGDGRLLSSRPIWERQSPSLRQQLYVGYQAGIQYTL